LVCASLSGERLIIVFIAFIFVHVLVFFIFFVHVIVFILLGVAFDVSV
jgi:hypothetical protein